MARPPLDTAAATLPSRSTTTAPTVSRHPELFSFIKARTVMTWIHPKNIYQHFYIIIRLPFQWGVLQCMENTTQIFDLVIANKVKNRMAIKGETWRCNCSIIYFSSILLTWTHGKLRDRNPSNLLQACCKQTSDVWVSLHPTNSASGRNRLTTH